MNRIGIILISLIVIIGGAGLILSCGGGGSDGSSLGNLQGTWFGVIEEYDTGTLEEFSLEIDDSGNVIEVQIGDVITGDSGHINEDWDENLFHVLYDVNPGSSPLSRGYMIVDNSYQHATYGDAGLFFAVIEKGATSLPAYASTDIVGSYSGGAYIFTYDSSEGSWNWEGDAISMTASPGLTFSGSSPAGAFSGGFDALLYNQSFGRYGGTLDITPPRTLDISALVSPDKTFVAAYANEIATNPNSIEEFILIGFVK